MPKLNICSGVAAQWEADRAGARKRPRPENGNSGSRVQAAGQVARILSRKDPEHSMRATAQPDEPGNVGSGGSVNSEPLLYYWQRNDQLESQLEQIVLADPATSRDPVALSLKDHCDVLQRCLQDTSASDMRTARDAIDTMSRFVAETDALALKSAYNDRARAFGKQLFDLDD